ncbi:hypothetical protein [Engelhardtia mirabilis]|uniref:Neutral zinc metallopeptidase n=1 Tax=Engelhardtia mirabilis TaxID=2528011 RepID=A0A518BI06_9BACT|nr:hypothetical protein Pla133_16600 [Planctomycetes bacterium Pla133]QDV00910.1 hypothetical protein Pla86_16590 [Planctomycetes bacterium Pla86]
MQRLHSTILLLPLLWLPAAPLQETPPAASAPVADAERARDPELLALIEQARLAVAARYGEQQRAEPVAVKIVDRDRLVATMTVDLGPQMRMQFEDEEVAANQARSFAETIGFAVLARYCWTEQAILVCPENFDFMAELFEDESLTDDGILRAVLVHEFVHANDSRTHDLAEFLNSSSDVDALHARNAVIEGHAQRVARAVCADQGWSAGFLQFTDLIDAVPPGIDDPIARMTMEVAAQSFAFAYYDGERLVDAVAAARGQEGIEALFSSPPRSPIEVLRPDWYLDPSLRPASEIDLERGLDRFVELVVQEGQREQRLNLLPSQVRAIFAGLPELQVRRFQEAMIECRLVVATDPEQPGAMRSIGLFQFGTAGEALAGLALERALLKFRDEQMAEGPIHIAESEYLEIALEGGERGLAAMKTVETPIDSLEVTTVLLVNGPLLVEVSAVFAPEEHNVLAEWGRATLEAALRPPAVGDGEVGDGQVEDGQVEDGQVEDDESDPSGDGSPEAGADDSSDEPH